MSAETDERFSVDEVSQRNQSADGHGNGGGPSGSGNTPIENEDENRVEDDVEDGASGQNPHGFNRITRCADQAAEVESDGGHKHSRQYNIHVFARVRDGFRGGTKGLQDIVHEQITASGKTDAKNKGEYHGVAHNFFCPVDVFAT